MYILLSRPALIHHSFFCSVTSGSGDCPREEGCHGGGVHSEAWEPPQFQEKRSRSEKAILGALGEFRGILGAALGIQKRILGMQNSILGMASHDLSNTKTTILGATLGAIPGIDGDPHERFSFDPAFSERFFKNWCVPRAPDILFFFPLAKGWFTKGRFWQMFRCTKISSKKSFPAVLPWQKKTMIFDILPGHL